VKKGALKFFSW